MLTDLAAQPEVKNGLQRLEASVADVIDEAVTICQVPAPPFQEAARADYVSRKMETMGLRPIRRDTEGDVICQLPGAPGRPTIVLMAHLDTVFGPETPIAVRRDGHLLYGPGIGDNSMALAAMLWIGRILKDLPDRGTLVLAANVGEEGLGNVRGAKALWEQFGSRADAWVILEGGIFNRPASAGIGSRRLSITYQAAGGHSWSDFGRPSAIHALGRLIDQVAQIEVPAHPKTTYNVGVIQGGRTVNTIAQDAGLLLDMRSEDPEALAALEGVARGLVTAVADASGVRAAIEVVGDRAGGRLPPGHPLIALVDEASAFVGVPASWRASSTDANVPLSHGASAVCIGIAAGEHFHSTDEVLDVSVLPQGLKHAYLVLAALLLTPLRPAAA